MPNRCARCDSFAGRGRELPLPADWLTYLQHNRDVQEPVGTLKLPLCMDCVSEVQEIQDRGDTDERNDLLDAISTDLLIDEH